jgi:hypothetical protein
MVQLLCLGLIGDTTKVQWLAGEALKDSLEARSGCRLHALPNTLPFLPGCACDHKSKPDSVYRLQHSHRFGKLAYFEVHIVGYVSQRRPSGGCVVDCVSCFIFVVSLTSPARKADPNILFSQRRGVDMHETHTTKVHSFGSTHVELPNRESS